MLNRQTKEAMVAGVALPLAAAGLTSYRYKGRFGYVMIGAKSHDEALREAGRSLTGETPTMDKLEVHDGHSYKPVNQSLLRFAQE